MLHILFYPENVWQNDGLKQFLIQTNNMYGVTLNSTTVFFYNGILAAAASNSL